jgi:YebC/PmpR family DNA-binding regulatory protein
MAGHSQFKNIMHRKNAQDSKKAKVFTKIIREITTATRAASPDPNTNLRLRSALAMAKNANMPKESVERAIARGSGREAGSLYEEIRYEGYGPCGIALIVETLTDNRNRTAPEIRAAFSKYGGNLGETNSVAFLFDHIGVLCYPNSISFSNLFDHAIECGANHIEEGEEFHSIHIDFEHFFESKAQLESKWGEALSEEIIYLPLLPTPLTDVESVKKLIKLMDILEENDDVQKVHHHASIPSFVLESL